MSAELPELERLLFEAAERHYGAHARDGTPWPRRNWTSVAMRRRPRAAGAALAAVLLIGAALPVLLRSTPDSDERAVSPAPARAAGPLDDAFGVFARPERSASALETRLLGRRFINDFLDKDKPKTSRLLYQDGDTGVVAVVGTAPDTSTPTVCLFDVHGASSGGGCVSVSDLLARRDPYVATGTQQGVGDIVWALVRDDVASVTVKTAGQAAHDVPVTNNLAFVDSPHAICSIRWTNRDGTTGTRTVSDPFGSRPDCR